MEHGSMTSSSKGQQQVFDSGYRREPLNETSSGEEYVPVKTADQAQAYGKDWTDAEERKLVFKLDVVVTALLTLCFFGFQLDRGNIGNTLTPKVHNLLADIGIDRSTYNIGQQLLYVGIVVFELPFNLILYRVGPRYWLSGQILVWGTIETMQCFINSKGSFYATRFLLGAAEAGFIPAGLYCLSLWYKRSETSKRFTIFYFGNLVSQGATSLLAYGILRMEGIAGLHGWQWIFILEGIFTVLCGVLLFLFLPNTPDNPVPTTRINYFTAREREILVKRVLLDDPSKEKRGEFVSFKTIVNTFLTLRVWPHLLISMCGIACVANFLSYAPALVNSFGYSPLRSNALVSIGGWAQIPISLILAIIADRYRKRGLAVFIGILGVWGFAIGDLVLARHGTKVPKFAILIITLSFSSVWQPLNGSWLSINCSSPAERSVTFAMFVAATNIGGIFGSQLFQMEDAPAYYTGWSAIVGLLTASLTCVLLAWSYYTYLNKKHSRYNGSGEEFIDGKRVKFWT